MCIRDRRNGDGEIERRLPDVRAEHPAQRTCAREIPLVLQRGEGAPHRAFVAEHTDGARGTGDHLRGAAAAQACGSIVAK